MNVLLVNPPSPYLENAAAYPPMGLLYVAASLEKRGCAVRVIDMACGEQLTVESGTDLVGFTCVTPNVNEVKRLIKEVGHLTPVMVGGAHPTFIPSEPFGGDTVVRGEFETVVNKVIAGVLMRNLEPAYSGGSAESEQIGRPSRHLVNLHKYQPGGEDATPVYTSRGCSYNCAFCSKIGNNTYRRIPLSNITEDIDYCVSAGFDSLVLGDDNFFLNKTHASFILNYIQDAHNLNLRINTDARTLDPNLLDLAIEAGCTEISMGIESGNQHILEVMNKRTTVERNRHSVRLLRDMGIKVKIYLVCNFPGETKQTVQDTIDFVKDTEPDKVLVSNFAPMPGCDVYENPEKYGVTWMSNNWDDYYLVGKGGGFQPCFTTKELTKEKQVELHQMLVDGIK